jgi:pimeloyl-ACP methyl ester carboxylesterase
VEKNYEIQADYFSSWIRLGLKKPVLIGWSIGCGELLSFVEQFGEDGISGLVLVDGLIPAKQNPEIVSVLSQWTHQLQQDRQKEADVFVRAHVQETAARGLHTKRQARNLRGSDSTVRIKTPGCSLSRSRKLD